MKKERSIVELTINGHQFKIACNEEDRTLMQEAAALVERKVAEQRKKNKVADSERAVTMVALMIALEHSKAGGSPVERDESNEIRVKIRELCGQIDKTLASVELTGKDSGA